MIQASVIEPTKPKGPSYPSIKMSKPFKAGNGSLINGSIVLFLGYGTGITLSSPTSSMGMIESIWDEEVFERTEGDIKLESNDTQYPHLGVGGEQICIVTSATRAVSVHPIPGMLFDPSEHTIKPIVGSLTLGNKLNASCGIQLVSFNWQEPPNYPIVKIYAGPSDTQDRPIVLFVEEGRGIEIGQTGDDAEPLTETSIEEWDEPQFDLFNGSIEFVNGRLKLS